MKISILKAKKIILATAAIAFVTVVHSGEQIVPKIVPKGILDGNSNTPVKAKPALSVRFWAEANQLDRGPIMKRYFSLLESNDREERDYAIWALQNLCSEKTLKGLLNAAEKESDLKILGEICWAINHQVLELFTADTSINMIDGKGTYADYQTLIKKWRTILMDEGYQKFLTRRFFEVEKIGREASDIVFMILVENYNPELSPLLVKVYEKARNEEDKQILRMRLLSWTGLDIEKVKPSELRKLMERPKFFEPEEVYKRYKTYFADQGYSAIFRDDKTFTAAVVFTKQSNEANSLDRAEREMAYRILTYDVQEQNK